MKGDFDKRKTPNDKIAHPKRFFKRKNGKDDQCAQNEFFLHKKLKKCRIPSQEIFCRRKETPFRMKQIKNTLFLEIISAVVESPCKAISAKERRQITKAPI